MPLGQYALSVCYHCITQEISHKQYSIAVDQISITCLILVGLEGLNIELYFVHACLCVSVCDYA